ncbi:MAG: DNA alkylation repair protein [Chloroflexota bacterium]
MTPPSATTERGRAIVAARRADALALGRRAGDLVQDPGAVAAELRAGLGHLADEEYLEGQRRVAPGISPILGVRQPLLTAVTSGLRAATRRDATATLLEVADRLLREDLLELHWLAFPLLERAITRDPERAWQLVRAEARGARDWITVDSLAHVAGRGILAEPYRWAELEQLVYSPWRWERRLVGSTIATIPYVDRTAGRRPEVAARGLAIVGDLIGDAEPDVQKALAWALRSLTIVDAAATTAFLRAEAAAAVRDGDGHRAWVVRDALEKLPSEAADAIRVTVAGVRKRPGAPSTSRAAETAAAFTGLGVQVPPAERPILPRP